MNRAKTNLWLLTFWFTSLTSLSISWAQGETGSETTTISDLTTPAVSTENESSHPAEADPKRGNETASTDQIRNSTKRIVALNGFAPLLAHVATHFYIGIGPSLYTEMSHSYGSNSNNDTKENRIGVELTVGGWR